MLHIEPGAERDVIHGSEPGPDLTVANIDITVDLNQRTSSKETKLGTTGDRMKINLKTGSVKQNMLKHVYSICQVRKLNLIDPSYIP